MSKNDDTISRQDAIKAIRKSVSKSETEDSLCFNLGLGVAEKAVNSLPSAEPKTGECRTCKRNADNGGVYEDGRTKCPIQEHYALLLDGYCHLYEQI